MRTELYLEGEDPLVPKPDVEPGVESELAQPLWTELSLAPRSQSKDNRVGYQLRGTLLACLVADGGALYKYVNCKICDPSFAGLVLGCIEADLCKSILVGIGIRFEKISLESS